jgi:replicative superfamily II helicase
VIDEFHQLLTDTSRGHLIEGLVVKLKLLTRKLEDENFRVVGLSATLPEIDRIAKWLNAEIYTANFRPVELCISAHVNNYKFLIPLSSSSPSDVAPPVVSSDLLTPRAEVPVDSLEFISHACSEISGNVLVFCASKSWCENTAISLAKKISDSSDLHRTALANALLHSPGGSSPGLHRCVLAGVAWHHGGLTSEQRGLIERGYRERHIRVICCTTTLAAGVNLGGCTQRVIIRSMAVLTGYPATSDHIQQRERLLQMAGRAGRTGSTSKGECFVCLDNRTQTAALRTLLEPMEIATSDELGHMNTASKRHYSKLVLECIGTGLIKKESEIEEELNRALLTKVRLWEKEWKELQEQRYAKVVEGELLLSPMGEAVGFSMMTIGDAEETQNELRMKLKNLKLDNDDFELLYLCVSINQVTEMPNMDERKFLPFIEHAGLTGSFMNTKNKRRWLTAFTLRTLLTCNDIQRLADQFEIPFSILMSLLTHSASHCATMVLFCERRKWHSLAAALSSLVPRLQYGLPPDIIPLTKIPGVFSARARALHSAGLVDVQAIAKADVREIAAAISRCTPVEHRVLEQHDAYLKKTAERIIRGAQKLLSPDQ